MMLALITASLAAAAPATPVPPAGPNPAFQKILERGALRPACDEQKAKFDTWTAPNAPAAPATELEAAMTALERVTYPTAADVALIRAEITRDFANAYVPYIPVAGSDCDAMRLQLARLVIKASHGDPKLRARYAPRLRAVMLKQNYETYLAAMLNALILERGLDDGLWSGPEGLRDEVWTLRREGKRETEQFTALYGKLFDDADLGTEPPSAEAVKRLDTLPERDRIKTAVLREMQAASGYLTRLRAFAERVH